MFTFFLILFVWSLFTGFLFAMIGVQGVEVHEYIIMLLVHMIISLVLIYIQEKVNL